MLAQVLPFFAGLQKMACMRLQCFGNNFITAGMDLFLSCHGVHTASSLTETNGAKNASDGPALAPGSLCLHALVCI